ncbi:class I SAM-dependent methyltransferase [Nocardiopsis composta]|uniref:Ubiquinone/menaquinone biosynthesis C-methylase UbiE n=1 Tax=Nocardiopsis composta TaxID=157465 RepID=A0A7W8QHX7_9ACTN|nr:class I SAM-dependent methyltransferase [Nocardiopsis composta]MBB5430595.1 ubiquinone/menaquinone biosynthesis C-methylase UbiE [Nocardiopsis composta]
MGAAEGRRQRAAYDAYAERYDAETDWYDRLMLGDGRRLTCARARGDVLEVAVGTGRCLPFYPGGVRLCGLDLSPGMLARARRRARAAPFPVVLVEGNAERLPFRGAAFDTVVCVLGLSGIPDDRAALREMHRVLRPGGRLLLLGHIASGAAAVRLLQRAVQALARGRPDDHQLRRTVPAVTAARLPRTADGDRPSSALRLPRCGSTSP